MRKVSRKAAAQLSKTSLLDHVDALETALELARSEWRRQNTAIKQLTADVAFLSAALDSQDATDEDPLGDEPCIEAATQAMDETAELVEMGS